MREFALCAVVLVAMMGLLSPYLSALTHAQEPPKRSAPSPQATVSDKELRAFAKAYVEFHKIRQAYEPSLKNAQDSKERQKIEQEANSKIEKALEKEGLTTEKYNRIFVAVNGNEELRKKTLGLIDRERRRS